MELLVYDRDRYLSLITNGRIVLFFSARWCGTCRGVLRALKALPDDVPFQGMSIDVETEKALADSFDVMAVPVMIYLENGIEIARHSGSTIYSELLEWLLSCGIIISAPPLDS